jgi:hypothetical protein
MTDSLRLSYPLSCSADHAFGVWTTRIATWWPKGHSATDEAAGAVVILEDRTGAVALGSRGDEVSEDQRGWANGAVGGPD